MPDKSQIIFTLILICGLIAIYKKLVATKDEQSLILKLIGYYLLGAFTFWFNAFPIPLGFLAYLLLFKPNVNTNAKKAAAYGGLIAFGLSLVPGPLSDYFFERPRYVGISSTNLYKLDIEKDWRAIKEKINSPKSAKVEGFEISYKPDGKIDSLRFEITGYTDGQLAHYTVNYYGRDKEYTITGNRITEWLQYDRLAEADKFFAFFGGLDYKSFKPVGNFDSYVLNVIGQRVSYAMTDTPTYWIRDGRMEKIVETKMPVEGYYISSYGMERVSSGPGVESYSSAEMTNYIFEIDY